MTSGHWSKTGLTLLLLLVCLIAVNVIVFLLTGTATDPNGFVRAADLGFGFIPSVINDIAVLPPNTPSSLKTSPT